MTKCQTCKSKLHSTQEHQEHEGENVTKETKPRYALVFIDQEQNLESYIAFDNPKSFFHKLSKLGMTPAHHMIKSALTSFKKIEKDRKKNGTKVEGVLEGEVL